MTKKNTTEVTSVVDVAAVNVAELEAKLHTAEQESIRAQALAIALPGRLAAGDQSVTTADLIHAGPVVAVAKAKVTAVAQELAAAREQLEVARFAEIVSQLRAGHPFMDYAQVGEELDRIAAYVLRELGKLGERLEVHNDAFHAVAGAVPRDVSRIFPAGEDGETLVVQHTHSGRSIELDGREWFDMRVTGWGADVLHRVERAEARARDAAAVPAPRALTWREILAAEEATGTAA
jgi:hypothetical protein